MQRREEEGAGVVDTGVDVEDHGEGRHGSIMADSVEGRHPPPPSDAGRPPHRRRPPRAASGIRRCRTTITYRRAVTSPTTRHRTLRRIAVTTSGLVALVLAGCSADPGAPTPSTGGPAASAAPSAGSASPTASQDPAAACVSSTLESLSPEQRLGQLLMVGFDTNAPLESLDDLVTDDHVGNVIYLGGWDGADKVTRTSTHLQDLVSSSATGDVGLMIAADQEGGEVHQLRGEGFTRPPSAKRQARLEPAELTPDAASWAEELKAAGINVNLAPVADTVPEGDRDRQRADRPVGTAVRLDAGGRCRGRRPRSSRGCSRAASRAPSSTSPASAGSATTPTSRRPASRTAVATADDPFLQPVRRRDRGRRGPGHDGLGALPEARRRQPGDVLREDRHGPAPRADSATTGVVITDDVNAEALDAVPAGDRAIRARRGRW